MMQRASVSNKLAGCVHMFADSETQYSLEKITFVIGQPRTSNGWLGSRVVSVLDSDAEGPGFKSQSRRCRVTVLGKLFTPVVPLFTK